MDKSDYLRLLQKRTTVSTKKETLIQCLKKQTVCMKEHVSVKDICGVPCDVFDVGGKPTKLSISNKIGF